MTHEQLRDLLPALSLGALDADERREVAAHVSTCAECAAELAALERVVDGIGLEAAAGYAAGRPQGQGARADRRRTRGQSDRDVSHARAGAKSHSRGLCGHTASRWPRASHSPSARRSTPGR
jgi:anti-sigma factor RsiW